MHCEIPESLLVHKFQRIKKSTEVMFKFNTKMLKIGYRTEIFSSDVS